MRHKTPRSDRAWRAITATLGNEINRLQGEIGGAFDAWHAERTARLQVVEELVKLQHERGDLQRALSAGLGRHVDPRPGALPDAVRELAARVTAATDTAAIHIDTPPTRRDLRTVGA